MAVSRMNVLTSCIRSITFTYRGGDQVPHVVPYIAALAARRKRKGIIPVHMYFRLKSPKLMRTVVWHFLRILAKDYYTLDGTKC